MARGSRKKENEAKGKKKEKKGERKRAKVRKPRMWGHPFSGATGHPIQQYHTENEKGSEKKRQAKKRVGGENSLNYRVAIKKEAESGKTGVT